MKDHKDDALAELLFCLELWEKGGSCSFGKKTHCSECGAPYVLYKICTKQLDSSMHEKRLSCEEWKKLINGIGQE